jgi:tRNA threonylcarbamoyladenosine biosynthesis protein TsaB
MPVVEELFRNSGIQPIDLRGIALALGPGGFSALRVGFAVTKGLALATGASVVGVRTLEMEAHPYASCGMTICPLLPSSKGMVIWALFTGEAGHVRQLTAERVSTYDELTGAIIVPALFCGEAVQPLADVLKDKLGDKATFIAEYTPLARLEALAVLGIARLARDEQDDIESLQPFYLRPPSIGRINLSQRPEEAM